VCWLIGEHRRCFVPLGSCMLRSHFGLFSASSILDRGGIITTLLCSGWGRVAWLLVCLGASGCCASGDRSVTGVLWCVGLIGLYIYARGALYAPLGL